ncbi:MAG: diguanylate cyclase [Gammaproteobacteria bacterium]|nr:diguanylate cyclase [Gammaproteobacteria bacterium]
MSKVGNLDQINVKSLVDNATMGVVIHNLDSSIVYANPTALRFLRLTFEQMIGKDALDPQWHFVDERGRPLPASEFPVNKVLTWKTPLEQEVVGVVDSFEQTSWFRVDAYIEMGDQPDKGFVVVSFTDITEERNSFSFRDVVENAQDAIVVTEASPIDSPLGPKIVYVNKAFEILTEYREDEVLGETPRILQGKFTEKETTDRIHRALEQQLPVRETILNYSKSGRPYWLDLNIIPLKNSLGEVTHFAAIERDVTEITYRAEQLAKRNEELALLKKNLQAIVSQQTAELKEANIKLEQMAYYDTLTQLPNRRYFQEQLDKILSHASRNEIMIMYGLVDIDDFKSINDSYGHDVGDQVLKMIASAFFNIFRRQDAYARLGGEEFAFALEFSSEEDVDALCSRLLEEVSSQTYQSDELAQPLSVTASIGVTYSKVTASSQAITFYRAADKALYEAKANGKNCYKVRVL